MDIDISKMIPINRIKKDKDKKSVYAFSLEAKNFLLNKSWCKELLSGYLGLGIDGILGVFYFKIKPSNKDVDNKLWVITGDLPPAYLVTDRIQNPPSAIAIYIEEMRKWVEAVKYNKSADNIIPVNVPPEKEYAVMLENRLNFLNNKILTDYKKELDALRR
jgi:hypothetical protein